ncbi:MAG: phosphate signaling complex protein PhoU [candidate division WOR-3 bacterium]|nr:phosphate signaling complex protein PhoU [candidate division WOR-3 bacterium]
MLREKVEKLKTNLLKLASIVEKMMNDTETAVYNRDHALANNVITNLEQLVNRLEIENETTFIEFLALFQPEAVDLRTVISLLKINNTLERIADHCVNIAQRISMMTSIKNFSNLKTMFDMTHKMFRETFDAFIKNDAQRLVKIIEQDKIVDEQLSNLTDEVIKLIDGCHSISNNAISALLVGRDLERIADLTTNICEDMIYMIEGEIVKHRDFLHMTP